ELQPPAGDRDRPAATLPGRVVTAAEGRAMVRRWTLLAVPVAFVLTGLIAVVRPFDSREPSHLLPATLDLAGPVAAASPPEAAKDAGKDQWAVFRGNPLQTGVAESTLPATFTELWRFETKDSIEGAPAVAGGVAYVGSLDENLYAIDL